MRFTSALLLLVFVLVSRAHGQHSPDYEDELVNRLVETVASSEFVRLEAGGNEFAALYRRSASTRAVILLHGMGAHADWPGTISSLRVHLPEYGWSTLSIQLPVLAPQNSLSDYGVMPGRSKVRIHAAIDYLKENGYTDIVLAGYGFGASLAVSYLANGGTDIRAFVGISMQEYPFLNPPFGLVDHLVRIDVPALDIYAGRDYSDVLRTVDDRRLAARRAGNDAYKQLVIEDADHFFSRYQTELVDRVTKWLDSILPERLQQDPFYLL